MQHDWQDTGISNNVEAGDWLDSCKNCGATLYTVHLIDGGRTEEYTPPEDGVECNGTPKALDSPSLTASRMAWGREGMD